VGFDLAPIEDGGGIPGWQEIKGDINDLTSLDRVMEGCEAVIHCVISQTIPEGDGPIEGEFTFDKSFDPYNTLTYQVNVVGTFNVLELARQHQIKRVVILSSGAVILEHLVDRNWIPHEKPVKVDTGSPLKYSGIYGLSKHLQEEIGRSYAQDHDISVIVFRPWWVVDGARGVNRFDQPLSEDSVGLSPLGFVDRHDLGEACYLALQHPDISFDIFYPVAGPGCDRCFDVDHLQHRLGWKPRFTFGEYADK
jgi:nucleoside-diphosphate-sugar epimerase